MTATPGVTRGTFLLEVALDRARVKQRLAAALTRERERRGGDDARRFPQPKMAELLGYSLRQYQRLEDPDDPSLPRWDDLEKIADKLGLEGDELFGDATAEPTTPEVASDAREARLDQLEARLEAGVVRLEGILDSLEAETARAVRARKPTRR